MKWIKSLSTKQRSGVTPEAFLDAVVIAAKPYARLSSGVPPLFVKQRESSSLPIPKANADSHEWAQKYILRTKKLIDKTRSKLQSACEEENEESIANMVHKIVRTPYRAILKEETAAARKILKVLKERRSNADVLSALDSPKCISSLDENKVISDETNANDLDTIQTSVDKFTLIALDWLSNNIYYYLADIETQIKTSPAEGISTEQFAALVVDRMKLEKRLNYGLDPKGIPVFTLASGATQSALEKSFVQLEFATQSALKKSSVQLELEVQAPVEKYTGLALTWLAKNAIFRVETIEAEITSSPVEGLTRKDFIAEVLSRMKQDERLIFVTSPNGNQVFLRGVKRAVRPNTSRSEFENAVEAAEPNNAVETAIQAQVTKFTAYALKSLGKIQYFHVANIHGQIKTSPVDGMTKEDFIACVVDRMKLDKQFNYTIDPRGNPAFKLASFGSTESSLVEISTACQISTSALSSEYPTRAINPQTKRRNATRYDALR
ncbi:hypothetical protein AC1031_014318 [Aphanomyces cochlioides]|nr:hypothetical protein AC1031_014318 [Aphanomyces cochlioides]